MIRIALAVVAFFAVVFGLLTMQRGAQDLAVMGQPVEAPVTRADTSIVTAPTPLAADLTQRGDDELHDVAKNVLAELGKARARTAPQQADPGMRDMTSGVLASLSGARAPQPAADGPQVERLEDLIVQALRQGQSDAHIDVLLNEAAAQGRIEVPESLVTSDGRVDTKTLLMTLVQKSDDTVSHDVAILTAAANGVDLSAASKPRADVRPVPRNEVYVVQAGDSLAAIAFRYYGETSAYRDIFAANTDVLSSPDMIRIGQRLRIPTL